MCNTIRAVISAKTLILYCFYLNIYKYTKSITRTRVHGKSFHQGDIWWRKSACRTNTCSNKYTVYIYLLDTISIQIISNDKNLAPFSLILKRHDGLKLVQLETRILLCKIILRFVRCHKNYRECSVKSINSRAIRFFSINIS